MSSRFPQRTLLWLQVIKKINPNFVLENPSSLMDLLKKFILYFRINIASKHLQNRWNSCAETESTIHAKTDDSLFSVFAASYALRPTLDRFRSETWKKFILFLVQRFWTLNCCNIHFTVPLAHVWYSHTSPLPPLKHTHSAWIHEPLTSKTTTSGENCVCSFSEIFFRFQFNLLLSLGLVKSKVRKFHCFLWRIWPNWRAHKFAHTHTQGETYTQQRIEWTGP